MSKPLSDRVPWWFWVLWLMLSFAGGIGGDAIVRLIYKWIGG